MTTPALMDFLREFRGRTSEPVTTESPLTTESTDADDGWSPPTGEWRPVPERVLGLADLVVGSDPSGPSGVDRFLGPAELEAAARGAWATPSGGWGPAAGESVAVLAHGAPAASLSESAAVWGRRSDSSVPAPPRRDPWDRQRSGHVLSLVQAEVLLALATTIVSIVVIALIAVH